MIAIGLAAFAAACGETTTGAAGAALAVEPAPCTGVDCPDPEATGTTKKGGGAGVATSSTSAANNGLDQAREKGCAASLATATAPACPNAAQCELVSTSTSCTYANESCPSQGTFQQNPRNWVDACNRSEEPEAWKRANCNLQNGPAGKSFYALCTSDATGTIKSNCEPKKTACEGPVEVSEP
jgi:hypothetical protein